MKTLLRSKHTQKAYSVLGILVLLLVGSCKKEHTTVENPQQTFSVTELKNWFQNSRATKTTGGFLYSLTPNWNSSEKILVDNGVVYEINCDNPHNIITSPRADVNSDEKKETEGGKTKVKLLIFTRDNKITSAAYMFVNSDNSGSNFHYKSFSGLTGSVVFYNLEGQFANAYVYSNGKVTNAVHQATEAEKAAILAEKNANSAKGKVSLADGSMQCTISTWDVYQEFCITIGTIYNSRPPINGKVALADGEYKSCSWEWVGSFDTMSCTTSNNGGGGGEYTPPSGSGGGSSSGSSSEYNPQEFQFVSDPAILLKPHFDCFGNVPSNGATYTISLSADLPVNSDPSKLVDYSKLPPETGHAFITLTKTNGNVSVTKSFGFYPDPQILSLTTGAVGSKINDNGGHASDAIIYNAVTATQFETAMAKAIELKGLMSYDINDYNCTNYAIDVFNSIRDSSNKIEVPSWIGSWGFNYGQTPNGLYHVLAQKKSYGDQSISLGAGNAPAKTAACN